MEGLCRIMKKFFALLLATILVFSFLSCVKEDTIFLTSKFQKESPSTVLSVELPRKTIKENPTVIKVGVGKRFHSQYNTESIQYIETVLRIDAEGAVINGQQDFCSWSFDITEEQYLCSKENDEIQYFMEIPLDFSNCEQTTGAVIIDLTSFFSQEQRTGSVLSVDYSVKGDSVRFSQHEMDTQMYYGMLAVIVLINLFTYFLIRQIIWSIVRCECGKRYRSLRKRKLQYSFFQRMTQQGFGDRITTNQKALAFWLAVKRLHIGLVALLLCIGFITWCFSWQMIYMCSFFGISSLFGIIIMLQFDVNRDTKYDRMRRKK